jgi:hypothetical protein
MKIGVFATFMSPQCTPQFHRRFRPSCRIGGTRLDLDG